MLDYNITDGLVKGQVKKDGHLSRWGWKCSLWKPYWILLNVHEHLCGSIRVSFIIAVVKETFCFKNAPDKLKWRQSTEPEQRLAFPLFSIFNVSKKVETWLFKKLYLKGFK